MDQWAYNSSHTVVHTHHCIHTTFCTLIIQRAALTNKDDEIYHRQDCRAPTRLRSRWPLALDLITQAFKADRAHEILHFFLELIQQTGKTFEQVLLGARGIDTIDPLNIEAILNSQFTVRAHNFQPLLGHGIFTQDGEQWRTSRDLLRPQFMQSRSENFASIQEIAEQFLNSLPNDPEGVLVDLQPQFFKLTLQTTMAVLVGRSSQAHDDKIAVDTFADAFNEAQHYLARRGRLGNFYWLLDNRKFRNSCELVHSYVDGIVQKALAEKTNLEAQSGEEQRYVFLQALMCRTQDRKVLRDHLLNILLAGRDTTACLLSWTIRLLAQHKDIQEKLRDECRSLPSFGAAALPDKAELKRMTYLDMVLREVLRLYPPVPVNVRTALQTTTLPRGGGADGLSPVLIRRGEDVGYCVYAMHRAEEIYGTTADQFQPERWSDTPFEGSDAAGWGYLPFNGGPRTCLGRDFALLEASYIIVRLLQFYRDIVFCGSTVSSASTQKHSLTLVLSSADGCKVRLVPQQ
ncbi:putative cytochrome P450 alkane hydroxylase [Polychaeton citri CBS 116435]|uniref:Cytochrome P450 alkane hydroxylase n=1 Tax=Polychaeton citri CBS 116435 TaxID=1314669 RepID=A0A9P4Q1E8_9PEZI|nr:putative cytochrome P450 alkane hydroxylase [Polychaeton citri CBS 116435]